jgi:hypothetical protein
MIDAGMLERRHSEFAMPIVRVPEVPSRASGKDQASKLLVLATLPSVVVIRKENC